MFRDFDYLDDSCWKYLRKTESAGVHIFNAWHEAWGEHKWYPADEPDVKELPLYGKMTKTFCRINSWYEEDGFWFDSQLRITPAFPPGRLYMEHLAHALASADARKITAGGLFVDKLHADIFREFSNIYCRLPNCKFEDVGSSGDPVTVRQLKREDSCCIYAVNREPYEVRVNWCSAEELHGSSLDGASQFDPNGVTLKPFELKAWNVNAPLTDFTCTVPEIVRVTLKEQVEMALTRDLPEFIARDLQQSLQNSCYSRLRHLLTSYPVHEE